MSANLSLENLSLNQKINSGGYEISLGFNKKKKLYKLRVKSLTGARHFAEHYFFTVIDDNGIHIETRPITPAVSNLLIENIVAKGETAGFSIYLSDIEQNKITKKTLKVNPENVRHILTKEEKNYTSTGSKLNNHWPIFKKLSETGFGSIIRATMTLHQVCSSRCQYCSTISRNKKDSISLDEAKNFVLDLYEKQASFNKKNFAEYNDLYKELTGSDIRLRGLILSGGGQPNLWPHFEEFVEWLSQFDIDLGLITNGFPKRINDEIYSKFKWVRLSITPEDASAHYLNGEFNQQRVPELLKNNSDVTFGLSYVYGPWTDDDILKRLYKSISQWGVDYIRMLTDCNLARNDQLSAHRSLSDRLFSMGYIDDKGNPRSKFFHQLKYHGTSKEADSLWDEGQCFLQSYNVFWDTTGHEDNGFSFCYACDSITVLAEEDLNSIGSERRFNSDKWGTVKNINVEELYKLKMKPFFDPREVCTACLFMKNNQSVKNLINSSSYDNLSIESSSEHVNFP